MDMAANIREARLKQGMTQEGLAQALGVTRGAIKTWEYGKNCPNSIYIPKIAETLSVKVEDLFR